LQTAPTDFRADATGDVITPLAPIEAGPAENPPGARLRRQIGTELRQEGRTGLRDFTAILAENDVSFGHQRVGNRNRDLARQMVIACARKAQRVVARGARLIARRHFDRGDRLDAFEHPRHKRRGDAVIVEAAFPGHRDKARVDQLGKVLARRRPGNMRDIGELAAGQRPAAHQGRKHGGTRRVADERGHLDHIGGSNHAGFYRRSRTGCNR